MKKGLSIILAFVMLFSNAVFANAEDLEQFTEGFYSYTVEDGKATIVDADGDNLIGEVVTPTTLGGYPVVAIGDFGMHFCNEITNLTVSEGVEILGENALFGCSDKLGEVNLPSTLRYIKDSALVGIQVSELKLPDGLEFIGWGVLRYNARLETLEIPESVEVIDAYAFNSSIGLKDVYIYNKDVEIGEGAFGYSEFVPADGYTLNDVINIMRTAFEETDTDKKQQLSDKLDKMIVYSYESNSVDAFIGYYMTIHGYTGSTAEVYAKENNIKFVSLDNEPTTDEPTTDEPTTAPEENESEDCSCMCHKTGFMGFIYKIMNFFWKIFRINPQCDCGVSHY